MARQAKNLSSRDLQIVTDNLPGYPRARTFSARTLPVRTFVQTHLADAIPSLLHVDSLVVMLRKGGERFG